MEEGSGILYQHAKRWEAVVTSKKISYNPFWNRMSRLSARVVWWERTHLVVPTAVSGDLVAHVCNEFLSQNIYIF